MVLTPFPLVGVLLLQINSGSAVPLPTTCSDVLATGTSAAVVEVCRGDEQVIAAEKASDRTEERRTLLRAAAVHYRRAASLPATPLIQVRALEALARVYDADSLNEAGELESVLLELASLVPDNLTYLFRLAAVQERQDRIEAAESTLLMARNRRPQDVEPYKELAQFFVRRAAAVQGPLVPRSGPTGAPPAPDDTGIYRVGGGMPPPHRTDVARYPEEAQAAGISGIVQAEITIDEQGTVTDATIVRSVPLLDEPALQAVRQWRYEPTIVDGRPVPVKMVVNVQFSLSK